MENILDILSSKNVIIIFEVLTVILIVSFLIVTSRFNKLKRKYNKLMIKLGNGNNLEVMLNKYIDRVEEINGKNMQITEKCNYLEENLSKCIQKIGIVRYNAFEDTGSDLSFALALLDKKDNGVIVNGIYSREASNTYAKSVESGKTSYTLSKEEEKALEIAKKQLTKI